MAVSLIDMYGGSTPQSGMSNPNQQIAGSQPNQTSPYAEFSWNPIDLTSNTVPLDHLGSYFNQLGYTGSLYDQVTLPGAGVNGDAYENRTSQALQNWLKSNNYSLVGSYGNDTGKKTGTAYDAIRDAQGNIVGNPVGRSFDDSAHWMDYAVPGILAAMFGGAAGIAAGGGGAAGGVGSDALLGGGDALAAEAGGYSSGLELSGIDAAMADAAASGSITPSMMGAAPAGAAGMSAGQALGAAGAVDPVFNAAKDSQTANEQLGITTPSTNAPSSVNLGSLGGLGGLLSNPSAFGQIGSGLSTLLGGGQNGLAGGLAGLLGVVNANNQRNEWDQMMKSLDSMYSPDSPYAKQMQETLARKDSAAGRNSQYGPRAAELAARLTEAKANTYKDMAAMKTNSFNAQNSGIRDLGSIFGGSGANAGIGQILSGLGTGWEELLKLFGD